ncbi:MAG TPA: response regulator transcription factor [Acidimicrobiales bacterium]|nr:response regulator transcription factor [Acidimicrobiales bacterium]
MARRGTGAAVNPEPGPTSVLVADDQRAVREGLVTILSTLPGVTVVGSAGDGMEALERTRTLRPDVVLMDLRMPKMDGIEATTAIRASFPDTQVVVLTTYADDESVLAALGAGAAGYLTKDAGREDIARAIAAAASGQSVLDRSVQSLLVDAARGRTGSATPPETGLTERELEVLRLMAEGRSNAEIGALLYIGEATVKTHVNRIFAKTASRDRAQAVAFAHRHGLAR